MFASCLGLKVLVSLAVAKSSLNLAVRLASHQAQSFKRTSDDRLPSQASTFFAASTSSACVFFPAAMMPV